MTGRLDLGCNLQRVGRRPREGTRAVHDQQHLVVALGADGGDIAPQSQRASVVASDVQHAAGLAAVDELVRFLRHGGHVQVRIGVRGADEPDAVRLQDGLAVLGAEIGIHDVEIGDCDGQALRAERQRVVDRDIGLAAAVVSGEEREPFMLHHSLLLMIFPLVVLGSASRNSTMRGYL